MIQTIFVKTDKTQSLRSKNIFFFENRAAFKVKWKNILERDGDTTDDNTIRRICTACWVTKVINIHSEYVIVFPL
jgi:hypothetical protein